MSNEQLYVVVGVPLVALVLSVAANAALYIHLSSVMNNRFDSVERRLEMIQANTHDMDVRIHRLEDKR